MKTSRYNIFVENKKYNNWLLYNSLQNSLVEIDALLKSKLSPSSKNENNALDLIDADDMLVLKEGGYIIDDGVNEIELALQRDEHIYNAFWQRKNIIITVCPTYDCNLRCTYCYVYDREPKELEQYGVMNKDVQDKIIHLYQKYCEKYGKGNYNSNVPNDRIVWFGGEPLLQPDIINHIQSHINILADQYDRRLTTLLVTNGILLTRENQKILKDNFIKNIQITIDGPEKIHNQKRFFPEAPEKSFEIIMKNLTELDEYFIPKIRINLDKQNYGFLENLLNEFMKRGIWPGKKNIDINVSAIVDYNNENVPDLLTQNEFMNINNQFREMKVRLFNETRKDKKAKLVLNYPDLDLKNIYRCNEAFHQDAWVVGPLGDIYTCTSNVGRKENCVGDINDLLKDGTLKDANKFRVTPGYRERFGCKSCQILPICQMNCFATYWRYGKITDEICSNWKAGLKDTLLFNYDFEKCFPELVHKRAS